MRMEGVHCPDVALSLNKRALGLGSRCFTMSAVVSFLLQFEGCAGHESDQFWKPTFRGISEIVLFCIDILYRRPFGGYFAAEEMVPADLGLVVDKFSVR